MSQVPGSYSGSPPNGSVTDHVVQSVQLQQLDEALVVRSAVQVSRELQPGMGDRVELRTQSVVRREAQELLGEVAGPHHHRIGHLAGSVSRHNPFRTVWRRGQLTRRLR